MPIERPGKPRKDPAKQVKELKKLARQKREMEEERKNLLLFVYAESDTKNLRDRHGPTLALRSALQVTLGYFR